MSAALASGYATPPSATSSSKAPSKSKPVNVFSNDGSFLERFQRSRQEEEDRRKAEDALTKKKQFGDRFKNRGKRPPPPDPSPAMTRTDVEPSLTKRPRLGEAPSSNSEFRERSRDQVGRVVKHTSTGARPLVN